MKILKNNVIKFDQFLPIYNWYYPFNTKPSEKFSNETRYKVFSHFDTTKVKSRALYFHIPFCETICSFCPFVRTTYTHDDIVEAYVQALIREIRLKSRFKPISDIPVGAIFFGGGTPSLLNPDQIRRIGNAIINYYDLSNLREFSFECEVKSISHEKLDAMREVGVTHARFGLQTFNRRYREFL